MTGKKLFKSSQPVWEVPAQGRDDENMDREDESMGRDDVNISGMGDAQKTVRIKLQFLFLSIY
ncbi:hypothetical protein GCM10011338_20060 [Alteromonas lipolytica]|uniref:Uncharacterized protein n=1 Tax=Alteromonas lipolytica TaxID=1856405 RepID=A0A1E8FD45_9ALTE|nr:hypothetical protein BFC17_19980 [Alteromonas lipolytica]GGF67859.1 hypothetical protein GCM10011338_20060 [Alteromonas lipolytica]